jgi:hypothetical protein
MKIYAIYREEPDEIEKRIVGRILKCSTRPDEFRVKAGPGEKILEVPFVVDDKRHYIDLNSMALVVRPVIEPTKEQVIANEWRNVRMRRDILLRECDYVMLADNAERIPVDDFAAWRAYRQELRDITDSFDDPFGVEFPKKPGRG